MSVRPQDGVLHEQLRGRGLIRGAAVRDAVCREPVDLTILDVHRSRLQNQDAAHAAVESVNVEISNRYDIRGRRVDENRIDVRGSDSGHGPAAAVNGDRLSAGVGANAAWSEDVDCSRR